MIASPDFMQTLAWSLLHFLWQGAALTALAATVMFVVRTPSARYPVGVGALVLMLVSFGVTFALLNGASDAGAELPTARAPAAALASPLEASAGSADLLPPEPQAVTDSAYLWIARLWLIGVCMLALRVAFGLMLLEHLRRRNLVALPAELVAKFRALQRRLGIQRVVRYCECRLVGAPAVIGFFRPIVLLPLRALTGLNEVQLEAVIAHELGHIKRFDVAVNFFQVIAETLFFFHPAVWWLNKRIRADREDCCDDIAVAASGANASYARALATMAGWRDVPEFAMAATGGPIAARIARLLGVSENTGGARNAGVVTASLVLMAALGAGAVSLGLAQRALAQSEGVSSKPIVAQAAAPTSPVIVPAPAKAASPPSPVVKTIPSAKPALAPTPAPRTSAEPSGPSYIDQMKSVGLENLDVDHLIAMKIHGVTPEYVRETRASGVDPDIDQLIAMKVHRVTPEYVKEIRSLGFEANLDEVISMKVHGIDAAYVNGVRAQGENPDIDVILAMKVHDVTPEYRRMLESAGFNVDLEEVIHAKVMDITPEFIEQVRAHGFKNLDIDKLIQLKHADVL